MLINNAGILPAPAPLADLTPESMREGFEVNCLAPLFLTRALLPLLRKAADANDVAKDGRGIGRAAVVQVFLITHNFITSFFIVLWVQEYIDGSRAVYRISLKSRGSQMNR